jgi:multidrug efflux pump
LTINRQAQFPVITISFNLAPDVHLSQAVNAVNKATKSLKMPVNV